MTTRTTTVTKRTLPAVCAAVFAFSLYAGNDYYVDAVNGDDAWDGSTAVLPDEAQKRLATVPGPRRTLAGAMSIAGLTAGDTVHAAPGVYNEGGMSNNTGSNRVIVAAGVLLVGDQGAAVTTIEGKISEADGNSNGCAADSMRAVCLADAAAIKGFTVTKGRSFAAKDKESCGGGVWGNGLAVDCVFSNNVAHFRGNTAYEADLLRCFIGDDPVGSWSGYAGVRLIDCVVDTPKTVYSYSEAYNTTFVRGNIYGNSKAYNCLFLSGNNSASHYCCLSTSAIGSGTDPDGTCRFGVGKAELGYDAATYRPHPASSAVDAGNDTYHGLATNSWTGVRAWWQRFFTETDYAGGARIRGAAIDIGAGEADPSDRLLTIADAQTALVVSGAAKGSVVLHAGETNTFALARDYSTAKLCTGVRVNGEFFSFSGENADRTFEFVYGYGDPRPSLVIEAVYAEHNDWYVNPNTDPAKGPVGDDANGGYTKYAPKRTLAGAMTNALLAAGDTVHAAAGVYNEGTMAASPSATVTNRVIVTAGVSLVADEGRDVTAIEGFVPDESKWGTTDPVRCVAMAAGARLKAFTVRNGMASMEQGEGRRYGYTGGGISGGTAVDCVVSNCYAVRGGGVADAVLIRCRVTGNHYIPTTTTNPAGGYPSITGEALYSCKGVYDSVVSGSATAPGPAVNSRFTHLNHNSSDGRVRVYNCYVENDGGRLVLTNSIVKWDLNDNSHLGAGSRVLTPLVFDADGRPDVTDPVTAAYAVDKGDRACYVYPAAAVDEAGKDFAGGQRIYNGQIDIGSGEYDARGDFTRALAAKRGRLAVDAATPDVTTNALGRVTLADGDVLTLALTLPVRGRVSLALDRTDGVTVTVDGVPVPPTGGAFVFPAEAGGHTVAIAYAGEGRATVTAIELPRRGLITVFR